MNRLAEKIKTARLKAKLSEKELAKKCGLSVGYIIQIESGKKIIKEEFADKILVALGEKAERLESDEPKAPAPKPQVKPRGGTGSTGASTIPVTPSGQWADALAGVIKTYDVVDCLSKKVIEHKSLPIISKKIEGHHPDKLRFVRVSDDSLKQFRIHRNDVLTVVLTSEIENGSLYLIEIKGSLMPRKLKKEAGGKLLVSSGSGSETVSSDAVKVLGKCIKAEFQI